MKLFAVFCLWFCVLLAILEPRRNLRVAQPQQTNLTSEPKSGLELNPLQLQKYQTAFLAGYLDYKGTRSRQDTERRNTMEFSITEQRDLCKEDSQQESPHGEQPSYFVGYGERFQDPEQRFGPQSPSDQRVDVVHPACLGPQYPHYWGMGSSTQHCSFPSDTQAILLSLSEWKDATSHYVPWGFLPAAPYPGSLTMPSLHQSEQVDYYRQYPHCVPHEGEYNPHHAYHGHAEHFQQKTNDGTEPARAVRKGRRRKNFPETLMKAFMDFPNEKAVSWLTDEKSFVVVCESLFVSKVLNRVFRACKYPSFTWRLNRWGFVRLKKGRGPGCFHHPLFTRNNPELSARIKCPNTPEDRKSVLRKSSEDEPSLAGLERFVRL